MHVGVISKIHLFSVALTNLASLDLYLVDYKRKIVTKLKKKKKREEKATVRMNEY